LRFDPVFSVLAMLNMDLTQRIVINTNTQAWQPSPMPGVSRKPLAREDAERGHATSIVRYDPGASFSEHPHPLGEEILVLEGTFSDQTGDYPAGTYFRNPEGFRHAPEICPLSQSVPGVNLAPPTAKKRCRK
jgi:anti-sigma factor ChrR (cupin superfamily)